MSVRVRLRIDHINPTISGGMKMTMANSLTIVSKLVARAPFNVAVLASLAFMLAIGGTAQAKFNASQVGPDPTMDAL
jgi:hypothetical protein